VIGEEEGSRTGLEFSDRKTTEKTHEPSLKIKESHPRKRGSIAKLLVLFSKPKRRVTQKYLSYHYKRTSSKKKVAITGGRVPRRDQEGGSIPLNFHDEAKKRGERRIATSVRKANKRVQKEVDSLRLSGESLITKLLEESKVAL